MRLRFYFTTLRRVSFRPIVLWKITPGDQIFYHNIFKDETNVHINFLFYWNKMIKINCLILGLNTGKTDWNLHCFLSYGCIYNLYTYNIIYKQNLNTNNYYTHWCWQIYIINRQSSCIPYIGIIRINTSCIYILSLLPRWKNKHDIAGRLENNNNIIKNSTSIYYIIHI